MFFTSVYYYIFLLLGSSCLLFIRKQRGVCVNFLFCILFVLLCLPALRETGIDRENYVIFYNLGLDFTGVEPAYRWISYFVKTCFDDVLWVFLIYAILGIGLKLLAIRLYSPFIWVSLLLYLSHYYVLHDMIQIRAGVASGILLLLTKCYYEKTKKDILCILVATTIATMFHYSGLLLLLPLFLNSNKINKKFYCILLAISIILPILNISITEIYKLIPISHVQNRVLTYIESKEVFARGIYTPVRIMEIVYLFWAISVSESLSLKNHFFTILLKIYIWSFALYFLCTPAPAVAGRIYELLGITMILLVPCSLYYQRVRIGFFICCCYVLVFFLRSALPLLENTFYIP